MDKKLKDKKDRISMENRGFFFKYRCIELQISNRFFAMIVLATAEPDIIPDIGAIKGVLKIFLGS